MSEIPGQSGHALPDFQQPVCAKNGSRPSLDNRSALPSSLAGIDCGLFARFKPTASALLDAPFSDGGRAGTKPNGFEL